MGYLTFDTDIKKRRLVGGIVILIILAAFLLLNRFPKIDTIDADLAIAVSPGAQCFQGFCIEDLEHRPLLERWWEFSLEYLKNVSVGMLFAFVMAGLTEAFIFPPDRRERFFGTGFRGVLRGVVIGPVVNLCSACIVPIANGFRRTGSSLETTVAITQSSSTLNLLALVMAAIAFAPTISVTRISLSVIGSLFLGPLVAWVSRKENSSDTGDQTFDNIIGSELDELPDKVSWGESLYTASLQFVRATIGYFLRLGPLMVVAGFASGFVIQWISPQTVTTWIGDDVLGVIVASTIGVLINVPLMFEIPLVAAMLLAGMGTAPAGAILFTAAAGGPITFWGLSKVMPKRGVITLFISTWGLGVLGGLVLLFITSIIEEDRNFTFRENYSASASVPTDTAPPAPRVPAGAKLEPISFPDTNGEEDAKNPNKESLEVNLEIPKDKIQPFTNISASTSSGLVPHLENDLPGVVIFDYDRDGDQDLFFTQAEGHPNLLFTNLGNGKFLEQAADFGVDSPKSGSTGAVACDMDNDGFQDLYVASQGRIGDGKNYTDALTDKDLRDVHSDRIFRNIRGTKFVDVTNEAVGDAANLRTGSSVGCADINNDGLVDIYVANRQDMDTFHIDEPTNGNLNVLYLNQGDMKFSEVALEANVRGDKTVTWAVLFHDFDDDLDMDLWTAEDGGKLQVYRNDTSGDDLKFVPVERAMGIDKVGSWMGFAVGDYDLDEDLDVFVTNIGYHPKTRPQPYEGSRDCAFVQRYEWGTCDHFLLKNNGLRYAQSFGVIGSYVDVEASTMVSPSSVIPPYSLDPLRILYEWQVPTGLAAYDFGFGTSFLDIENDGDQDLYWLGSALGRGESRLGKAFPSAGRMLRNKGDGTFEDITVETHLLAIMNVDYSVTNPSNSEFDRNKQRLDVKFHENGKGLAVGDINQDGYIDIVATNSKGEYQGESGELDIRPGPIFTWVNPGGDHNWAKLRLIGGGVGMTNSDAIGAKIFVSADLNLDGELTTQVSEITASSSFLSMSSLDQHFGLGLAKKISKVVVVWPTGLQQTLYDVPVNTMTEIKEPSK